MVRSNVDLPQPEGPTKHGELARRAFEVDAAHGLHMAIALVQAGDLRWPWIGPSRAIAFSP